MLRRDAVTASPTWPRALSENEARVVSSLLGASLESEEGRIREAHVPRTSYLEAKRRLFELGVLADRYIPHPDILGTQRVTLLVSRPHSDKMGEVIGMLHRTPGAINLWSGTQLAFAIVFHRTAEESKSFMTTVGTGVLGSPLTSIQLDPREPQFPVFFDFEGAWNHLCNRPGTVRYPRPLPGTSRLSIGLRTANRVRDVAETLARRPFSFPERGIPPHLLGPAALPREERRLIRDGAVDWRVVLQLDRQISYSGRALSSVIFITGKLRPDRTLPGLFHALVGECGVSPFLLAGEGRSVLAVGLGTGLGGSSRPSAMALTQRAVRPTLREYFETFDSVREPMGALRIHRYLSFCDHDRPADPGGEE